MVWSPDPSSRGPWQCLLSLVTGLTHPLHRGEVLIQWWRPGTWQAAPVPVRCWGRSAGRCCRLHTCSPFSPNPDSTPPSPWFATLG